MRASCEPSALCVATAPSQRCFRSQVRFKDVACRSVPFSQLFLCLSRACLGKISFIVHKTASQKRFRTTCRQGARLALRQRDHRLATTRRRRVWHNRSRNRAPLLPRKLPVLTYVTTSGGVAVFLCQCLVEELRDVLQRGVPCVNDV